MLLQSLLLIVTLTVLGGSILASTLVTAKAAFHAKVLRAGDSAMTDATADFVAWAQKNARENGIEQLPAWSAAPQSIGPAEACAEPVANVGSAVANQASSAIDACKLYETIRWNVTGYTGSASSTSLSGSESLATGLASAQDEQRVSATITVIITDASQSVRYATRSREVTARVFHSAPYVSITAERDAASEVRSIASAEGDTAGFTFQNRDAADSGSAPDQSAPAKYANTIIKTTIDCVNTSNNASPNASLDNNNVVYSPLRRYGNLAWVYEVPCRPTQPVNPATSPVEYQQPVDNVYQTHKTLDSTWSKNDENGTSFAW